MRRSLFKTIKHLVWVRFTGGIRWMSRWVGRQSCQVGGYHISIGVNSHVEQYRADSYSSKEPETLAWIDNYFKPGEVFWDIGANIGLYSLYAARARDVTVLAFEPESLNFARLNQNICANQLSSRIRGYCLGLSDEESAQTLYLHPDASENCGKEDLVPGSSMHNVGQPVRWDGEAFCAQHEQGIFTATVDCLVDRYGLNFPDHVKIDVDGLEGNIIQGMKATLRDRRLKTVLVEVNSSQTDSISLCETLERAAFREISDCERHSPTQLRGGATVFSQNRIFVR